MVRAATIVRVHELATGSWICQIWADNPDANWGERGQLDIRRTDHVHFAARLIGIAKIPEIPGGNSSCPSDTSRSTSGVDPSLLDSAPVVLSFHCAAASNAAPASRTAAVMLPRSSSSSVLAISAAMRSGSV